MRKRKIDPPTWLLFIFVVLVASLFRLTNLELIEFKADEALNLFLASRPLFGHPFPPGGTVSSVGILNPPLLNYLLFPLTFISLDPKIISFFIGLINALTVGFFFLLINRYYDRLTALIASLLLALSPWAILFSRKIWTQNLLLPFFVVFLFSFHKIILEKKPVYWVLYVATSLYLIQLHQTIIIFLLLLNGFLVFKRIKFPLNYIALGFGLGILPALPYFAYIFNRFQADPTAILVAKERFGQGYFPLIFFRPLQILSQGNFHFVIGDDMVVFARDFSLAYHLRRLFYLEYLLLPIGIIIYWQNYPKLRPLVYASLCLPLAYFLLHFEPFIHYFLILIPLLFLFLASVFTFSLRFPQVLVKSIALVILLALVITSFIFNFSFYRLLNQEKALAGDYGTAFVVTEKEARERLQEYEGDPHYQEMLLASYLPRNFLHGDMPVPKMIYSFGETEKNLEALEKRLAEVPADPRVQIELLAFYTVSPPTEETLRLLGEKSRLLPGYEPILAEVNRIFIEQNP